MNHKVNILFLLVLTLLCFCVQFAEAAGDDDKVTVYVTVTANSTSEEKPTMTMDEDLETPTTSVEDTPEYKSFQNALNLVDDNECLDHLIIISLNLFHANEVKSEGTCQNSYSNALNRYRKEKPCSDNKQLQRVVEYMDAHIQLLCQTYESGTSDITDPFINDSNTKMCPLSNYLKSNYTRFHEQLLKSCKKITEKNQTDTLEGHCLNGILSNYKKMEKIQVKLDDKYKKTYTYSANNATITFKMDINETIFDELKDKCKLYALTSGSIVTMAISLTTIFIFSLFVTFINI